MTWWAWLWRRTSDEAELRASHEAVAEARALAEQSEQDLADVRARWPEVDRLARAHERHQRRDVDAFKALFPEIGG